MSNKILITGAEGWLGTNLLQLLQKSPWSDHFHLAGAFTFSTNLLKKAAAVNSTHLFRGDLRNPEDARRFCALGGAGALLIHTAGIIHPKRVREFYEVNVQGTRNLLRAAAAVGFRRAVVISSNSPFGFNPSSEHRFDETSAYNPYMNYGRSKMLMEQEALEIMRQTGLEIVILRPPWFYGPPQPPRQTLFFRMIRDGKVPLVGDGNNRRSMAYVEDLARACLLASTAPTAAGKAYWVADERPYTMNEIIGTIETLLEKEFGIRCVHRRIHLPAWVSPAAQIADGFLQSLGFYHQKIHVLSEMGRTIACDISLARQELGFEPTVALEEGMRRSIRWCLENGGLDA